MAPSILCRLRRIAGPALGSLVALLVTAAGWPASAHAVPSRAGPAPGQLRGLTSGTPALIPVPGGKQPQRAPRVAPLRRLMRADIMVVSSHSLPASLLPAVRRLRGVRAAVAVDAAQISMNGKPVAVLGVDPSSFRGFADRQTARNTALWQKVASGNVAVSYTMGRLGKLPPGSPLEVVGLRRETLPVGGIGTVGIAGVDAVVSDTVARTLGFPARNALVISTASARISAVTARVKDLAPRSAAVEQLVVPGRGAQAGAARPATGSAGSGPAGVLLSAVQTRAMLRAALSRVGMPYVWGAEGPARFDCSGLVQWSFAQAGIVTPRVAADQARAGYAVPVSRLAAGDLLFYHTDPTAPNYISHVAIYLGKGWMLQAPQPGESVEVVRVDLGSDFAGAVAVSPKIAAAVAATSVG